MQFFRRIVILSLLLAGVSGAAHAQAVLYGRVTDNAGEPIPSANLYVEETEQGIATQDDGTYRLSSLSAGTHTIVVSAVGFQAVEEQVTLEAGEEREWDVSLEPTVLRVLLAYLSTRAYREVPYEAFRADPAGCGRA